MECIDFIDIISCGYCFENDLESLNYPVFEYILQCISDEKFLKDELELMLEKSLHIYITEKCHGNKQIEVVKCGISCLMLFIQMNWTGPPFTFEKTSLMQVVTTLDDADVISALTLDGECCSPVVKYPAVLLIAKVILRVSSRTLQNAPCVKWWLLRCLFIHQYILDEFSTVIHNSIMQLIDELTQPNIPIQEEKNRIFIHLEALHINMYYTNVSSSKKQLENVFNLSNIQLELVGALGKRTHFQEKDLAQLALQVNVNREENFVKENKQHLPKDLPLNDEVRLNHIKYAAEEDGKFPVLQPIEQAVVLGKLLYLFVSQPKDHLADDELMPYFNCILSQPQSWCLQMSTLLLRCRVESNSSRTIERAMLQVQSLVDNIGSEDPCVSDRLQYFFISSLPPRWKIEAQLASLLVSLGCVKSALDVYLSIKQWDDVITCYNFLKMKHKAEEVIRQLLEKKETVKLWCLLGDATDDVSCYEKAWELSEHRSGRAQRDWAMYYFSRKQYGQSIPHFQKSLDINSLQTSLWYQLGFACLEEQNWELSATAYRRCCSLDPDNFEAWNNLAKAYVKLGQKARAWRALQEAIKCNYENWRVWENIMLVSTDCGEFEEVIRAYHRILDLKGKHVDNDVLKILVSAIINNLPDNKGDPAGRLRSKAMQLFGRLTAQILNDAILWQLYAQLTASTEVKTPATLHKAAQYYQKACQAAVRDGNWVHDISSCINIVNLCIDLAKASLECSKNCNSSTESIQILTSAKLPLKAVITKAKQEHVDIIESTTEVLVSSLHEAEENLVHIIEEISQLQGTHS